MIKNTIQGKILKLKDTNPAMIYEQEEFALCVIKDIFEAEKMTVKLNEILSSIDTESSYEEVKEQIVVLYGDGLLALIEDATPFENIISSIRSAKAHTSTSYEFYTEDYMPLPVFKSPDTEYWNVINKLDKIIAEPMSEDYFWELISRMDYGSDLNYKRIKNTFKDEITVRFKVIYNKLYSQLESRIDEMLQNNGINNYEDLIDLGDDSLGDLIAHIIGLGKDEYEKCMLDIQEVSAHAKGESDTKEGYSESFDYIF